MPAPTGLSDNGASGVARNAEGKLRPFRWLPWFARTVVARFTASVAQKRRFDSAPKAVKTSNRNCVQCGKRFDALKYDVEKGMGKYCSRDCYYQARAVSCREQMHSRSFGGKRPALGNLYVRSRWEANYAHYLNWLVKNSAIQKWEYEPDTFEFKGIKRGTRFYTPDFKVFNNNGSHEYHEVKGYMDAKSQTKLKRMRRYYPSEKLILIDRVPYREIADKVSRLIPEWESSPKRGRY